MATTISNDVSTRDEYTATGGQTTFPYTFWAKEEDHIDVYVNDVLQTLTTDYTVSGVQIDTGANIVFNSGLALNDSVVIVLNPDIERTSDYQTSGNLKASTLNLELAYITSLFQYLNTKISRVLSLGDSTTGVSSVNVTPVANEVIGWNSAGTALQTYAFGEISNSINAVFTSLAADDYLQYDGTNWVNITPAALASSLSLKELGTNDINELTAFASIADQSDLIAVYDTSASETKQITIRNLFATIDDISAFNDAPASNDKFAIVNVSNGNANALTHEELMRVVNLTEDASPDLANDFLLSYDASAGEAKKVKPTNIVKSPTLGTPQATTSGSSISFTSIPAGTKKIIISFVGVSVSGTSAPLIQLGDSGGIETTGYLGSSAGIYGTGSTALTSYTTGFGVRSELANAVLHGNMTLALVDSSTNTWSFSSVLSQSTAGFMIMSGGSKSLSAELDRVIITTLGGVDTFDAGQINIQYF